MSADRELRTIVETGLSTDATPEPSSPTSDEFRYPDPEDASASHDHPLAIRDVTATANEQEEVDSDDEEFRYPGAGSPVVHTDPLRGPSPPPTVQPVPEPPAPIVEPEIPRPTAPTSKQLESVASAATAGDLEQLQLLFQEIIAKTGCQSFVLANDAAPRTGLTALHHAASKGRLQVVQWLVSNCGAMIDLEDKEGETALHKASLNGRIGVVKYILGIDGERADVHAQDADGWTALHNACSKGYLDIVRFLCEKAGAAGASERDGPNGVRGVDRKSKGGWTPLMNAASKGHLPVVLYLLTKQNADPLVRNNWGETAYDAAAAVFEVWICEVLQKAEIEKWEGSPGRFNPLAVHTAVPLIIYEHQRLDTRLKTLAVSGGRPKFSSSGLGRKGRKAPFELRMPPGAEGDQESVGVPAWRTDVQLPLIESPFALPRPRSGSSREGAERSHFWLSDWTLDLTDPRVDVDEGWQYARALDEPEERWTADMPAPLERLLGGSGVVPGFSGTTSNPASPAADRQSFASTSWARRRRWVRVMRRRLDIPPLPFLMPDGKSYHLTEDGNIVPVVEQGPSTPPATGSDGGQELGSMPTSFLSASKDYVARARYLAGSQRSGSETPGEGPARHSLVDTRRTINKLERAVNELRAGMLGDEDPERRTQAEVLLNAYSRELERTRLAAGANGLFMANTMEEDDEDDNCDSDESFHYPSQSPAASIRAPSVRSHAIDYFSVEGSPSQASSSRRPADLTPQLSQAPEFRVPTHEMPQKVRTPTWTAPTAQQLHAQWERDERVSECRSCKRRFTFYFRKHHCRRCGRIYCDRCSSHRARLDPTDVVQDPAFPEVAHPGAAHRVCDSCFEEVDEAVPSPLRRGSSSRTLESIVVPPANLAVPGHSRDQSSQISDLADCPVCGQVLGDLGPAVMQEAHVKSCLDGGGRTPTSATSQGGRYIVYKLPVDSALVGDECVICLEEFAKGSLVARMSCLCTFHSPCLSSWLQRGRACPVHARDT